MSLQITYCARGCTRARRHLTDCPDRDDSCPGCEPRQAQHGRLCWPCHHHLTMMLTDAPTVVAWLGVHLPRGTAQGKARNDAEMRKGTTAPPTPVDLDVIELGERWAASLWGWADELAEEHHLTPPGHTTTTAGTPVVDVPACARFLLRWITTVEASPWAVDLYDELADLTRDSHHHTPWSPEVRRVHGIPCPECHTCALVVYGGQSDVTCQSCRLVIPSHRYGIWTRMLAEEHAPKEAHTA